MPTYAYACKDCTHAFDIQQSFSEDSLTVCPECGGNLRKKFNSVGVVFKGSGFYRTDSRDAAKASSVPAASSGSGTDAAAAKPAAAAEPAKPAAAPAHRRGRQLGSWAASLPAAGGPPLFLHTPTVAALDPQRPAACCRRIADPS